jgi:hypothetical protein
MSLCAPVPLRECFLALAVALVSIGQAFAQLPTAQLTSVFPAGGQQGSVVELTIAGADLDDCSRLLFNHSGITAKPKMVAATTVEPEHAALNQFVVNVSGDVPPGTYEVRAVGRFGVSNPRSFVVSALKEINDASANSSPDKALDVPLGTTVNGRIEANSFEFLRLNLKKGERALIEVAARRIDSRLDPTLVVLDPSGRELKKIKEGAGADPVLDFTAPESGPYLLKLYDEIYGGGSDYFYRLTASAAPFIDFVFPPSAPAGSTTQFTLYGRNLPGGKSVPGLTCRGAALEMLPVNISLPADEAAFSRLQFSGYAPLARAWQDAIEYRLPTSSGAANPVAIYFSKTPAVVMEAEPNSTAVQAQKIAVPCEIAGQFYPERDTDWFEFDASKGQRLWIEAISNQLGLPSDPFFGLYRVTKNDKGQEQQTEIAQVDDLPERANRRPTTADEFDASSDDPAYKFVAPESGTYRLMLRDQFGDSRKDPSMIYRLAIREPKPDFRLVVYPTSPPANQQQQQQTALATASIRRGGTVAMAIVMQRRDEFDGEIAVNIEGLPRGVSCPGAVLGGGVNEGSLVIMAADDAAAWAGPIKVVAKGQIGGREVTREARYGVVVWGTPNRQQQPAEFRLAPSLSLGVIDKEVEPAFVRVGEEKVYETSVGATVEIPIKLVRRDEFKDAIKLTAVGLTQQMRPKDVTFSADNTEAKFELALNQQNIRPGSYTFYMKGESKRKYARNPDAVASAEAEQKRLTEMIKAIEDEIKSATEAKNDEALKAAKEKLSQATEAKSNCDKRVDDVKKVNQSKDVPIALISTPVRLRVASSPFKLSAISPPAPLKPGDKQALAVNLERLYGFTDQVDVTLEPPAAVQGLSAQKLTLKKDEGEGKLEVAAADDASPGEYVCTLRARGRFNNVQVESTLPVQITLEK